MWLDHNITFFFNEIAVKHMMKMSKQHYFHATIFLKQSKIADPPLKYGYYNWITDDTVNSYM